MIEAETQMALRGYCGISLKGLSAQGDALPNVMSDGMLERKARPWNGLEREQGARPKVHLQTGDFLD